MPNWQNQVLYADLRLENNEIVHIPSGSRTLSTTLVALLRSHPQPIKTGLGKVVEVNSWLQGTNSEVRVHLSAVRSGGPKAWLERGDVALLPVIEPRHT